jgi:uncharacterized protein (TIRG00374 family)
MRTRDARALIIGIVVSLLALYFALKNVDVVSLFDSILSAKPAWMLVVLLSYMLHFWLKAIRWCDLLEPVTKVHVKEAYPVMMTGFFANNFLPAHLGELVRMYVGSKIFRVGKTQVFATIVLERVLDFTMVALMFGTALIFGDTISNRLTYAGYVLIAVTSFAWILLFISLRYQQTVFRFVEWALTPLPARIRKIIVESLLLILTATHSMKSARRLMTSASLT